MAEVQARLWNWLKNVEPYTKTLAWCHRTNAYRFRDMVESAECSIKLSDSCAEGLLYLFYGRPAYRLANDSMSKSSSLPIVLLFDPLLVQLGKRLYPFDSGAFQGKLLNPWMDPEMQIDHFQLECGSEPVRRFVRAFFESNDHYLRARGRKDVGRDIKQYGGEFEVSALVRLHQGAGEGKVDNRAMVAELQLATSIVLSPKYLRGLIYPDELEQADWFTSFLDSIKRGGVKPRLYEPQPAMLNYEYQGALEEHARVIQDALGYI
jgi:hypothetical protein